MNQSFNQSVDRTRIPTPLIISHIFGTLILSQSHRRPTILCMDRVQSVCPFTLGYIWVLFFLKDLLSEIWGEEKPQLLRSMMCGSYPSACVCVWESSHNPCCDHLSNTFKPKDFPPVSGASANSIFTHKITVRSGRAAVKEHPGYSVQ